LREIDIGKVYESVGPKHSEALLGFYVFNGCDQIGRFNGKSKLTCWNTSLQSDSIILDAYILLGKDNFLENEALVKALEKFVVDLYVSSKKCARNILSLADARWILFSKYPFDFHKLPPTESTLFCKILRSHYISKVLKSSNIAIGDNLDPSNYGWTLTDDMVYTSL